MTVGRPPLFLVVVLHYMNGLQEYASEPQNEYQRALRGEQSKVANHQITIHTQQTVDIIKMVPDGGTIYDLPDTYWNVRKYRKGFERMPSFKPCLKGCAAIKITRNSMCRHSGTTTRR